MDTIAILIQIPPREIAFLTFLLESYEGVTSMRTIDPQKGIMELMVPPHQKEEVKEILYSLARELPIHYLTPLS